MTEQNKSILKFLLPFSFIAAACWHLPYWSTFDVNPFLYMGLNDIVMGFIYPFVFSILFVIIGTQLGPIIRFILAGPEKETTSDEKLLIDLNETEKKKQLNVKVKKGFVISLDFDKVFFLIKTLILLAIVLIIYLCDKDMRWATIPFLILMLIIFHLADANYLEKYLPKKYYHTIVFVASVTLTSSVYLSKMNGMKVRDQKEYEYTYDLSITNERLKVLGKLGDFMILTTLNNDTKYVVPLGNKNVFEIKTFETKKK